MKPFNLAASAVTLAMIFGTISCSSSPPAPAGSGATAVPGAQPMLAPHLPRSVADGTAAMTGPVGAQQILRPVIQLPLRNQAELTQLLHDLYDPKSRKFHQYLSVSDFTARFAPTARDYAAVVAWAKRNGLKVIATTPNRRLVAVEGSVNTVNRAFHVTINNYRHPTEGRTFYSPNREPSTVGLTVPLLQITGLNNSVLPHPMFRHGVAAHLASGSGTSGEFLPSDMRAAYYGNGPLTGAGQSIGIFSFDGYLASDVQLYYSKTGMTSSVPINNVLVGGFNGACTSVSSAPSSTCDDGEQVLDIVNAIGMAPGIKQILFYEGTSNTQILNQMATDNIAKVLSSSWGWNPADAASDDPIFQQFAAQGQTFVTASGDDGELNSSTYDFPAVDQYITQVGGTVLTTAGPGGAWSAETAWPQSGGGFISGTPIPSWQQLAGVINASNQGSTTLRNSPDVAAEADFDNPTVSNGAFMTGYGGTSFATPRWAGFLALVNQQSVANGKGTVGFLNPALYNLGVSSGYSGALHDITSGSNPPTTGSGSGFNAVPGYDLVTGWGSPTGVGLINQLAGGAASSQAARR
ncbi:MAG TPA: S53 family serine peptidase [Steroidobacteraceae bacterium]